MSSEPELTAYAASLEIKRVNPAPIDCWKQALENFFNHAGRKFKEKDGAVIGHIKGFLKFPREGYSYLSTVGTKQGTDSRWEAEGEAADACLDFNVLVYGWKEEEVEAEVEILVDGLKKELGAACNRREIKK